MQPDTIIQFAYRNRGPHLDYVLNQAPITTDKTGEPPMQRTGSSLPLTKKTGLPQ